MGSATEEPAHGGQLGLAPDGLCADEIQEIRSRSRREHAAELGDEPQCFLWIPPRLQDERRTIEEAEPRSVDGADGVAQRGGHKDRVVCSQLEALAERDVEGGERVGGVHDRLGSARGARGEHDVVEAGGSGRGRARQSLTVAPPERTGRLDVEHVHATRDGLGRLHGRGDRLQSLSTGCGHDCPGADEIGNVRKVVRVDGRRNRCGDESRPSRSQKGHEPARIVWEDDEQDFARGEALAVKAGRERS